MQDSSFEQNEARVFNLAQKGHSAQRQQTLPSRQQNVDNERPTKDKVNLTLGKTDSSKIGSQALLRQKISIDENEDTFHNQEEFKNIVERGRRLKDRMNEALDDDAWRQLHGPHEIPKASYINPFQSQMNQDREPQIDNYDAIYNMEIEAGLNAQKSEPVVTNIKSSRPGTTNEMMSAVEDLNTAFGGNGGNLSDMRFIRMKVKSMTVTDNEILQQMIAQGFSITSSLPLADIYNKTVSNQTIKLSNYDVVGMNEFEFQNLSLYNFKISEETFSLLAQSELSIQIDGFGAKGTILMGKLLLSPNFQLKTTITLQKSLDTKDKKSKDKKTITKGKLAPVDQGTPRQAAMVGQISIELNLQQGDTEEELMRNYKIKLSHQQEYQQKAAEIESLEKRKRAIMQMEQQPTFAQLYLHIDKVTHGGIQIDREGNLIENPHAAQDHGNNEPGQATFFYPPRNIYIQYKSFPTFEKLVTSTQFGKSEPSFNHRSQFPILMSPTVVDNLERFTYVFEVWDSVSPGRDELIGLVKVPLSSFCYTLKTTQDDIFSLNFLADQHSKYPMVIVDEDLPIYSPKHGLNVGYIKVMMGLGSPIQVNRQIERESDLENQRQGKIMAEERSRMQSELMIQMARQTAGGTQMGQEEKFAKMIEEQADKVKREEEDALNRNPLMGMFQGSPGRGGKNQVEKFANALRNSLQANAGNQDYDIRSNNLLNSLRKLFEEVRASPDLRNLNGEDVFGQEVRTFTGEVHKDDFIYVILDKEQFTLTRTEASNICQLMLNINPYKDDKDRVDIDELQYSLVAYTKYYELVSSRVADLLEKIKLAVCKRIDEPSEVEALCEQIMEAATDSKILPKELRKILEDQYNIVLRETIYDQLQSYFDLDRSGVIYISSVVQYLLDPTLSHFNFFKVNPNVITSHITEYVRNCVSNRQEEQMAQLETSFINSIGQAKSSIEQVNEPPTKKGNKKEDPKKKKKEDLVDTEPAGFLLHERINAKLFQHVLKKQGIALSLWEIFTLFEYLNTQICKQVFYEPQRYHAILWEHFYTLITGKVDYREDVSQRVQQEAKNQKQKGKETKKGGKAVLQAAPSLENSSDQSSDIMAFSDQSDDDDAEEGGTNKSDKYRQRKRDEKKPYTQVKHVFDINVKSLQQIPILDKFIRDSDDFERSSKKEPFKSTYIQNVAMKYSFPLDEDEVFESDYIRRNLSSNEDHTLCDFEVSMNTVHTYKISRSDTIKTHLKKGTTQLFNLQVVLFQSNQEFVIGNAQLPIEDLLDLVSDYENCTNTFVRKSDTAVMKRVLFVYGTSYSQRENCIIGKVSIEISYGALRQILTKREAADTKYQRSDDQSCYMHRETYVNRKIPLNALLSVYVDRVSNIKESIENIEHFAKINNIVEEKAVQLPTQKVDRRKILTQILKKGLNLQVLTSIFQEDDTLKERFKTAFQSTRILYNSLCPVFSENYQQPIQMDTKIFDYLKTKRAVFEVRHYLHQNSSSESVQSYFTLGYVKVPLLQLITKNNGIEGEFMILDDYKQKMGSLRLRINLNHHDLQRPLFQSTNKIAQEPTRTQPNTLITKSIKQSSKNVEAGDFDRLSGSMTKISESYILALNFCEVIMRERSDLIRADTSTNSLYLQFKLGSETYKTKFIPLTQQENLQSWTRKLQLMTFQINKTILVEVDMNDTQTVEEMFSRPLEVQLWHKVTAEQRYAQPSHEELLGSFFLEMNELPKFQNRRFKSDTSLICHEGYFSMYDFKNEKISHERLGCKLYLIPKRDNEYQSELDRVFNTLAYVGDQDKIHHQIYTKLDPLQKGYVELEDLTNLVQEQTSDKRIALTLQTLIAENLEFKNSDSVFYSPLFCLPPPYFKHSSDLDSMDLISKLNAELNAIDIRQEGYVPLSMLKQVVIDNLSIKPKIFDDMAEQMQPNFLDVNIKSNNLNPSQVDFVLLIRKMVKALPHAVEVELPVATQALKLNIQIESAMRLRNPVNQLEPPNSFVRVRSPFEGSLCNVETKVVQQSCYPYWLGQNFKIEFPLTNGNVQKMQSMQLEFEVYHQISQKHGKNTAGEQLIGVAYVDISPLHYLNSQETSRMISGYYHIVDKKMIQNSQQLTHINSVSMSNLSFGQLKLTINVDRQLMHQNIPEQQENPFVSNHSQTFGGNSKLKFEDVEDDAVEQVSQNLQSTLKPEESKFISQTIDRIQATMSQDEDTLRLAHAQNMSDLDALTKKMQLSLQGGNSDQEYESIDFTQTAKYDDQRRSLVGQLHIAKNNLGGVLNPFESKINEHSEEDFADEIRSEGNDSFAREQE